MGVRVWLLQEAGTKAGRDVEDLGEMALELNGRGGERARLAAHLPPVKECGKQSV